MSLSRRPLLPSLLSALLLSWPAQAATPLEHGPDLTGDQPAYCAVFSAPVKQEGVTLRDFVSIDPATDIAVTAQGKQLCLQGLTAGQRYTVTVRAGLPATDGSTLAAAYSFNAALPNLAPSVRIGGSGFVLPREGSAGLGIETVNVDTLRVKLYRASDRLASRLTLSGDLDSYDARHAANRDATLVWSGEMTVKSSPNQKATTAFPLAQALPKRAPGVYLVAVEDTALTADDDYEAREARSTARWLVETDIAPTTYTGQDGLTVVARSLSTALAAPGLRVTLVAEDNQILGETSTNSDGVARFAPGLLRGQGGARPASLMLYGAGGDFSLLKLDRPGFDFSDRGADGRPPVDEIEAFVWTERGIYRPGETVHAALLLRDRLVKAVDGAPVTLVVRRPDGREFLRRTVKPMAGGAALDIPLSSGARRGDWSVTALLEGGSEPVGEARFEVQDFVPPKLKVSIDPPAPDMVLQPDVPAGIALTARFLYGAPGADLTAGGTLQLRRDPKPFPAFAAFQFGPEKADTGDVTDLDMVQTDAAGRAELPVLVGKEEVGAAPMAAAITVEVQEPGGRITRDSVTLPVRGAPVYLGLRPQFPDKRAREGQEAGFELVALDPQGKPLARPDLRWTLYRIERHYVWYQQGNRWNWRYSERESRVAGGTVAADAGRPVRVAAAVDWGHYRMEVVDAASGTSTDLGFYAGWSVPDDGQEGTPDKVEVGQDRPAAKPGQTVQLKLTPPFAGQMQLVLAGDKVHSVRSQTVGTDPVTLDVTVDRDWGAGTYALVSFIRPVEAQGGHRPVRAVGLAWIGIDGSDRHLAVSVQAPERVRPRQTVPVTVTATGADTTAFVTLAAVDEGILNLTRYAAPDPYAHFFAKRRLGVAMRDQYGRLLDGNAGLAGAIREGGDAELGGAGLPVSSSRVVALFSGVVPLKDGKAVIPLEVPDFAGTLRLMAVAYDATRLGGASADMLVRDPVVAELVLPRFLAPGDVADATLLLHNVEGKAGDYTVKLTPTGPVTLADPLPEKRPLAAGEQKLERVALKADAAGIAGFTLAVQGPDGLSFTRSWDLTVRPAQAPVTLAEVREQAPGERLALSAALLEPFQPGTARLSVSYSRLPGIDVPGLLKDLNRYPYGCTEQTVSVALPLLAFPEVSARLGLEQPGTVGLRVEAALARLLERQKPDGSFGLWSASDDYATPWLQMYVLDFLQRAQKAGHAVPPTALADLTGWVRSYVGGRLDGGGAEVEAVSYGAWLLARAGSASLGDLRYLNDAVAQVAERKKGSTSRTPVKAVQGSLAHAQLGAALSLAGDTRRAAEAFERARKALGSAGRDYYASPEREAAATLAVAASVDDKATVEAAGALVQRLAGQKDPWSYNTQQKGWLLLAAQALLTGSEAPSISVDGPVQSAAGTATLSVEPSPEQLAKGFALTNSGTGTVWRSLTLTGVPRQAPPPVAANGLSLNKSFHTLDGKPLDPARLPRNSRIVVVLDGRLDRKGSTARRTLVLVDPLPAGWEIESVLPREADGTSAAAWAGEVSRPALLEGRDDRLVGVVELGWSWYDEDEAETTDVKPLGDTGFRIVYLARAVTPGQFTLPPATVEDMYDSATIARTAAGRATVTAAP